MKEFLSRRGISFREHDVSRDRAAAQELVSRTGQMAVPVTVIDGQAIVGFDRARLEQALNRRQRPSFGASVADAARVTLGQGAAATSGAFVGRVRPGSVAEKMGLAPGDVIVELNMRPIDTADDLEEAIAGLGPGSRVSVVFLRSGKRQASEGAF